MMQIHRIAAFNDNYFWLIQPDNHKSGAYIVDPGAAQPVLEELAKKHLSLCGILLTHHHHDHIDGALELQQKFNVPIYGPNSPRIPQVTHHVSEDDRITLDGLIARILTLPGHTLDHIGYFIETSDQAPALFSGDTLFGAGCGRLFDGQAEQLFTSLERIARLPENTLIYAAHEYTLANLHFALSIEPHNELLIQRQAREQEKRDNNLPTLPTTLSIEKQTNPFLRCHLNSVIRWAEDTSGQHFNQTVDVFTFLRKAKDHF